MDKHFEKFVKIGVKFPKKDVIFPTGWQKFTESKYSNEKNFAVLTGLINGIIVIDLDLKEEKFLALDWFEKIFGKIENTDTLVTKSVNGGYHIYFKYNSKIPKKIANKDLHIDILSTGNCCFQGEGYTIISKITDIRDLNNAEITSILSLKNKIKQESSQKDNQILKLNKIMNIPGNTDWRIIENEKGGHKAIPNCLECLVNPEHQHSQHEHSALYINKDKSIIKNCYSCDSQAIIDKG